MPRPASRRAPGPMTPSFLVTGLLALALALPGPGCGRSAESDPAALAGALPEDAPLVPADAERFTAYLKAALGGVDEPAIDLRLDVDLSPLPTAPIGSFDGAEGAADGAFSTTNLQTAGVDEADSVRFDGRKLYVARPAVLEYHWPEPAPLPGPVPAPAILEPGLVAPELVDSRFLYPEIEVLDPAHVQVYEATSDPASAEPVARIAVDGPVSIRGLLTLPAEGGQPALLVVVSSEGSGVAYGALDFWDPWFHSAGVLHVQVYDIDDPLDARPLLHWRFEGTHVATRRVGDQLVLVSTHVPYLRRLAGVLDPAERERRIAEASLEELLPRSWIGDDEEGTPLVPPERCFVPASDESELAPYPYRPTLATIAMLDLRELTRIVTVCAAGPVDRIFASPRSLVLASSDWAFPVSSTWVHEFALSEQGPRFRGSARVPGRPAGSQPGFGIGEHEGTIGVLTRDAGAEEGERHRLTLLRQSSGSLLRLEESAHLPNASRPAPIGKPDEEIYGVRFVGDRVYVVTFRRIDPLYVIDVSDPTAPFIAGELELPGFSDYLQPLGSDLLLGVGMATLPGTGGNDWFQGVKVELFDVSEPSAPASLEAVEIGERGSSTAASDDHQAVNWIDLGDGRYRVAVPMAVHEEPTGGVPPTAWYGWSRTALQLFEVDAASRRLERVGEVVAAELGSAEGPWGSSWGDRARLQGDAVHYVHEGEVFSAPWHDPGQVVGPQ